MKKINYVIATYAGTKCVTDRENFVNFGIHPKDYLKIHLRQLIDIPHNLTQVTIMKAAIPSNISSWPGYYDIDDLVEELSKKVKVEIYDVPNHGISYGQYIRSYDLCKHNNFNYWILMEDDYVPVLSNFDTILTDIHKEQSTGVLCAWASSMGLGIHHAAHSLCVVDELSMFRTFNDSRIQLAKFSRANSRPCQCQIIFSQMFTQQKIAITDYTQLYCTPYWTGRSCVDCCCNTPKNPFPIFIPLQMITADQMSTVDQTLTFANDLNKIVSQINFVTQIPRHIRYSLEHQNRKRMAAVTTTKFHRMNAKTQTTSQVSTNVKPKRFNRIRKI